MASQPISKFSSGSHVASLYPTHRVLNDRTCLPFFNSREDSMMDSMTYSPTSSLSAGPDCLAVVARAGCRRGGVWFISVVSRVGVRCLELLLVGVTGGVDGGSSSLFLLSELGAEALLPSGDGGGGGLGSAGGLQGGPCLRSSWWSLRPSFTAARCPPCVLATCWCRTRRSDADSEEYSIRKA